jgi:hypothetical protein
MGRGKRMALALLLALAAIAGGERAAAAQSTPSAVKPSPRVVVAETTSIEARLDAVDVKTRRMTVTGPHGKTLTLKVGPDVKDLDQVKPGDQLAVRYFEPLALFVRKATEPRVAAEGAAVQVIPRGKRPVPVAVDTVEFKGTVEAIEYAKRRLTLKGPEGKTRTIKVDPGFNRFDGVKKGDQIVVRYTEATAFSVRKA